MIHEKNYYTLENKRHSSSILLFHSKSLPQFAPQSTPDEKLNEKYNTHSNKQKI